MNQLARQCVLEVHAEKIEQFVPASRVCDAAAVCHPLRAFEISANTVFRCCSITPVSRNAPGAASWIHAFFASTRDGDISPPASGHPRAYEVQAVLEKRGVSKLSSVARTKK